ncbi:hypothetical protein Tco_1239521, partial [Tanacetum coccineum]
EMVPDTTADDNKFNADAFQEYTPPPEEGIQRRNSPAADVKSVAINENATRRLPIGNQDTIDGTTVPVSRNFDRFRDMHINSLRSNYMTHAGIRHLIVSRSLSTTLKRKSPAADVLTVGTSRNVRRRLSIGNHDVVDRTCVPVSRIFQRFKDMPTNNVEPEYRTHTAVVHSSGNGSKNAGNLSGKKMKEKNCLGVKLITNEAPRGHWTCFSTVVLALEMTFGGIYVTWAH